MKVIGGAFINPGASVVAGFPRPLNLGKCVVGGSQIDMLSLSKNQGD